LAIEVATEALKIFFKTMKNISKWFNTDAGQAFLLNMSGAGNQGGMVIPGEVRDDYTDWLLGEGRSAPSKMPSVSRAPITVNVTGLSPTATIGRTILEAVNTANRLGVR